MGKVTEISWTDHTFNPWWGCVRVSPGCVHCYAETFDKRVHGVGKGHWGVKAGRRFFGDAHWNGPLKWNREAERDGVRRRVFCASMADVFEDRDELVEHRARLFLLIQNTPHLDWLLLTKRPENMVRLAADLGWEGPYSSPRADSRPWPDNVWAGCTVEDQQRANERIPELLRVPAAVRFLSCEPLIGPVDLDRIVFSEEDQQIRMNCLTGEAVVTNSDSAAAYDDGLPSIHWVICGGESGHGARPMHPWWARTLRDACQAAGVAFHFKQHGEFCPTEYNAGDAPLFLNLMNGEGWAAGANTHAFGDGQYAVRLGKHRSGRLLDGRTWDEWPASAEVA
jgi:protein gp37